MVLAGLTFVRRCSTCLRAPPTSIAGWRLISTSSNGSFEPRKTFSLPSTVPSWYAGHMYRAMRSLPSLLARSPPPLILEVRDARLPLSSINPAFEDLLVSMERTASAGSSTSDEQRSLDHAAEWRARRLIVYTKRDLIDERLCDPLKKALEESGQGKDVMFIDSKNDRQVRRLLAWIKQRAAILASTAAPEAPAQGLVPRSSRPRNLTGAFKHTPTPDEGVRLIILGMPNVGKSSLLNALRRVGTGKGKAASTAPEPGHTRKLTGTVRITKQEPTFQLGGEGEEGKDSDEDGKRTNSRTPKEAPVYVYDTPGVMVPFLGHGRDGAQKGVKLAVAAGIKSSLFDAIGLADYLLYRLNLQYAWRCQHDRSSDTERGVPLPAYLEHLPLPKEAARNPTNDIFEFLGHLAERAPGTLSKGGQRDLDAAAQFFLDRWRHGKLGRSAGELDLGCWEERQAMEDETSDQTVPSPVSDTGSSEEPNAIAPREEVDVEAHIRAVVRAHFDQVEQARREGVATSMRPAKGADRASRRVMERSSYEELLSSSSSSSQPEMMRQEGSLMSKNQAKKRERAMQVAVRNQRLRESGVNVTRQFAVKKKRTKASTTASAPAVAQRRPSRPRRK